MSWSNVRTSASDWSKSSALSDCVTSPLFTPFLHLSPKRNGANGLDEGVKRALAILAPHAGVFVPTRLPSGPVW
jgi:hypothetical protein